MNSFQDSMAEWQRRFEEMRLQFLLGKMDAADAFEQYKEQMKKSLQSLKSGMDEMGGKAEDGARDMGIHIEKLLQELSAGKAAGMEAFREQREKIEAALNQVYTAGKSTYNKEFEQAMNVFEQNSTAFKTGLEIMQLQFALAKMNTKTEAEALQKSLNEKMNELSAWFKSGSEQTMKSIEEWSKAANDNLEMMKKWSADFMNSFKK
jgi:hypothetical protein